jgi:hypothetical protein
LQFFEPATVRTVIQEAFRVSARRVMVLAPNARSVAYRFGKWWMERRGTWHWGREVPVQRFRPFFRDAGARTVQEYPVAARHSLDFLTFRGGSGVRRVLGRALRLHDHARPARFNQGYMLVSIGDK